jgi:hypothetical protein
MEILNNIKLLADPALDLNSVSLLGIRLGDPKEKIPAEIITESHYWIFTEAGVSFRDSREDNLTIVEFAFMPEVLKELGIDKKEKIEKTFRQAVAIERIRGTAYYFYPSRKIVVAWDESNNGLFRIF